MAAPPAMGASNGINLQATVVLHGPATPPLNDEFHEAAPPAMGTSHGAAPPAMGAYARKKGREARSDSVHFGHSKQDVKCFLVKEI